jgi:hypothetical protein
VSGPGEDAAAVPAEQLRTGTDGAGKEMAAGLDQATAAAPGLDRRASHEDQIVNLGLMATDFPQYRLSSTAPSRRHVARE